MERGAKSPAVRAGLNAGCSGWVPSLAGSWSIGGGGMQTAERPLESVVSLGHVTENIRPWEQLVKLISSSI